MYLFLCRKVESKVCCLYVGQLDQPFAMMKYTSALKELDGKIVECKFENEQWKFMRIRSDKSYPNSLNTAKGGCVDILWTRFYFVVSAVWGSIQNPVTKEKLLDFIERYRFEDDTEIMPPPPKRVKR